MMSSCRRPVQEAVCSLATELAFTSVGQSRDGASGAEVQRLALRPATGVAGAFAKVVQSLVQSRRSEQNSPS